VIIRDVEGNTVNITPVRWNTSEDEESELMLKYSRAELQNEIITYNLTGEVEVTVTGTLLDVTSFIGSDTIKVKSPKKGKK
jgi:hypothetical protein